MINIKIWIFLIFLLVITIFSLINILKKETYTSSDINSKIEINDDLDDAFTKIQDLVINDSDYKNQAYKKTAYISDTFGPRLWGLEPLQMSINQIKSFIESDGINVKLESIPETTMWIRGKESLILKSPRKTPTKVPMIGLGLSVSGNLIDKEVVVVETFEELDLLQDLGGKILLINGKWDLSYFNTVKFRSQSATRAAKKGASGVIIRSIAPKSLENPHTGRVDYEEDGTPKIPACAISLEDADMFARMYKRGQKIVVDLYMEGHFSDQKTVSYNLVAEIKGSEKPDEVIVIGGHLDSWDTGSQTGANDDLAGFYVCYEALRVIKALGRFGLVPKKTIRVVGWTGEEQGASNKGAFEYAKNHDKELENHVVAFESDEGTTLLQGFGFNGSDKAFSLLQSTFAPYKQKFPWLNFMNGYGETVDTLPLFKKGVPQMKNLLGDPSKPNYNDSYFYYHHSAADSVYILSPQSMDSNVIGIAQLVYGLTTIDKLPR